MAAASRNQPVFKNTIRLFSSPRKVEWIAGGPGDELDESDVWCCQPDNPRKPTVPRARCTWKKSEAEAEAEAEAEEDEVIVPPHEVVMRRRTASLSVLEGAGRTLKGRDLSRVRDAIWAQTGFQD